MHSVSSYHRTKIYLQENNYKEVLTYLDNDKTGEKYTARFKEDFPEIAIWPQNHLYAHFKDVNEVLKVRGFQFFLCITISTIISRLEGF